MHNNRRKFELNDNKLQRNEYPSRIFPHAMWWFTRNKNINVYHYQCERAFFSLWTTESGKTAVTGLTHPKAKATPAKQGKRRDLLFCGCRSLENSSPPNRSRVDVNPPLPPSKQTGENMFPSQPKCHCTPSFPKCEWPDFCVQVSDFLLLLLLVWGLFSMRRRLWPMQKLLPPHIILHDHVQNQKDPATQWTKEKRAWKFSRSFPSAFVWRLVNFGVTSFVDGRKL